MINATNRPRVVIIGAGFGGLAAAKRLAGRDVDVTLVDRRNHHVFQPLLYQVATAALSPADIAGPIRAIFSRVGNVRVVLDEVCGVDAGRNMVELSSGGELRYDWLIVATGARHSYFGRDDWSAHAPGLKSIEDALAIRRKVLLALELAENETDAARRRALLTFVVIGGGPTGVEMAGAIAELARQSVSGDFRSITPHCSRVILIEAGDRVLASFPKTLSARAEQSLRRLGVDLRLGAPVEEIGDGHVYLDKKVLFASTVIWAAGVEASPAAEWLRAKHDGNGRVIVGTELRLPGHPNVFAIGDTAKAIGVDGSLPPAVAPAAKQQGRYVADVILGRTERPFRYRDFGNFATIGRNKAVIVMRSLELSGFFAWLIWSVAHIWFLIGFRSRLSVTIGWLWNYLTYQRSARLITGEIGHPMPQPLRSPPSKGNVHEVPRR